MSVYLTGDVHCPIDVKKLNTTNFPEQRKLTRDDYVIVLGDFGLLWKEDKEYYHWLEWFREKPFTLLWLDGNHENHDWIDSLPVTRWHGGKVHQIADNIIHLMRGQVFCICDKYFWVFGGAQSYDKAFRKPHVTWWPREEASYAEQSEGMENLVKHSTEEVGQVDYILTHTCPESVIEPMFKVEPDGSSTGKYLDRVFAVVSGKEQDAGLLPVPVRAWYFGHWHKSVDFEMDGVEFYSLYNSVIRII